MKQRLILCIAIVASILFPAGAKVLQDSVKINFRQSKVYLDTAYMGNSNSLQHARNMIEFYHRPDSNFVLTNVEVVGGASPEGSVRFNEWLSHERAARIFEYIGNRVELPDSITKFTFLGRDWEGLRRMVIADPNVPYREELLSTLDTIIENYRQGETEGQNNLNRIKQLRGGKPYQYIYRHLFPTLRASTLVLTFGNSHGPIKPLDGPTIDIEAKTRIPYFQYSLPPMPPSTLPPFYMDLRTNLLYDALGVPNIGVEFYLGRNISAVGNWMYSWWKNDARAFYWRLYGGDLALRWWFGSTAHAKPLTGHHIGIYGSLLTYDFELGARGYMGGIPRGTLWDRCNYVAGVEYGYSLPVGRRLNIDFTVGVGRHWGEYQVYDPLDSKNGCYIYRETRYRNYWGPTKAEISLVWLIGRGNFNLNPNKKGGLK